MKSPLILSLLALVVSAVGFVFLITRPAVDTTSRAVDPVLPSASGPAADVLARLDELARENRALQERLVSLELRPAAVQRAPVTEGFVSREEFDAFRDEVLQALGGTSRRSARDEMQPPSPVELQDFRDHVAEALTEIRKQEAVAKFASLEERAARLDETMPKLEDWLGLSRQQSDKMRSVLLAQYEREADIVRRWQEGADPEILGAMKRNDREVHQAELAEVLTPEQLATYTSRGGGGAK